MEENESLEGGYAVGEIGFQDESEVIEVFVTRPGLEHVVAANMDVPIAYSHSAECEYEVDTAQEASIV